MIISDADAFAGMHTECSPVAGEPIHLVVEVTSPSTRERDYREKMRAYAAAGLPHYLVIDREDRACRLYRFADGAGSYGPPAAVAAFGESLPLPEPIGFALGTSRFE